MVLPLEEALELFRLLTSTSAQKIESTFGDNPRIEGVVDVSIKSIDPSYYAKALANAHLTS